MEERGRIGGALILGGCAALLASFLVDFVGVEHSPGIGRVQWIGILAGVAVGIAGFLLRRGGE
ncbi:MAG: hypothetical protein ABIH26_05380 [Candidatus Eisenbacteria bacterium]